MMTRRAFLARLGLVAGAVSVNGVSLDAPRFRPDAFSVAMAPLDAALRVGDIFTIEGRYMLHPITLAELPYLQQFIVTRVDADGAALAPPLGDSWI